MKHRRAFLLAVGMVVTVLLVRAALPTWITGLINDRIAEMGPYRGQIADVDLSLYRGAYRIRGLMVEKRSGKVPVPLLRVPKTEIAIRWREVLNGAWVGEAELHHPELNFVDGRVPAEKQSGRGVNWRQRLEGLAPIRLDRVGVRQGTITFRNPFVQPSVDVRMQGVEGQVTNLTNVRDAQGGRVAVLGARARVLGHAPLELAAQFDPLGHFEDFAFRLRVTDVALTTLNDLARAYAAVDVASGRGDFVLELDAQGGRLQGYAKPLLDDLEVLDWEQDVERNTDNPLQLLWEGLSGAISALFRNQPMERFATRIPIEGNIHDPHLGAFDATIGVLRNAFVEAYGAHFENGGELAD